MAHVLFRCPYTGLNVQHLLDEDAPSHDKKSGYEAMTCPACTRLHFVNRSTGKILGENKADEKKAKDGKPSLQD
jgi:hypothetical protein